MSNEIKFLEAGERSILAATLSRSDEAVKQSPPAKGTFVVLAIDGAAVVELDGPTLFGREPTSNFVEGQPVHHIKIDANVVSRQHLAIIEGKGEKLVLDLGSSNGSVLHRADQSTNLKPHEPAALKSGDTVVLGNHLSIQVVSI